MTCDKIRENFADYLAGDLDDRTLGEIRGHLAECATCRAEVENLSAIWTKLGVLPQEHPGPAVREKFYGTLEAYIAGMEGESGGTGRGCAPIPPDPGNQSRRFPHRRKPTGPPPLRGSSGHHPHPVPPAYQAGLAFALLAVGLGGGFWLGGRRSGLENEILALRQEVGEMRQTAALSLLRQPSSSDRLMGVSWAENLSQPGQPAVDALVRALNEDPSVNVRLAAVDALYLFAGQPGVKEDLVDSLANQSSPLVQVALIDSLVSVREKRALESLKLLAADEALEPGVRKKAESGIKELSL